jgi:maltose alpha-D-glucosyltransferase/alpha-amylase
VRRGEAPRAPAIPTGDPAYDPEPIDGTSIGAWSERTARELDETLELVAERAPMLPDAARAAAEQARGRAAELRKEIAALAKGAVRAVRTRYHGDYHLGQVLVTGNDFVITDFEGEPARSLEERREKATALKDVAGMLRSFDYAATVAAHDYAADAHAEVAGIDALLADWRDRARKEFLGSYRDALGDCAALPQGEAEVLGLLRLATLERLLYEVRYELKNRPEWAAVPLGALAKG